MRRLSSRWGWLVSTVWAAVLVALVAGAGWAQQAPGGAAPGAPPSGQAAPQQPQEAAPEREPLPEQWQRIGELFVELLDSRIGERLTRDVDPLIRQRLQEALATVDARLAGFEEQLSATRQELGGRLDQLAPQVSALDEQVKALRAELDSAASSLAAIRQELQAARAAGEQQQAEIRQLRNTVNQLTTRFWIATGVAALALVVGLLR